MTPALLFPRYFKFIGLALALPGFVLGYLFVYQGYIISFLNYGERANTSENQKYIANGMYNFTDEIAVTLILLGLLFIGFSRLKKENELIGKLRLNAIYWAVIVNCILVLSWYIIYIPTDHFFKQSLIAQQLNFVGDIVTYNFFVPTLIYILRFYYLLYSKKQGRDKTRLYLLPNKPYSLIGKIGSVPFILLGFAGLISTILAFEGFFGIDLDAEVFIGFLPFLLLWIWSKEKDELAVVKKIRLKSMQFAVFANAVLFILLTWLIYGLNYWGLMFGNLISIQLIFIITFYFQLYQLRKKHSKSLIIAG